jgi:hypothetical protein
MLVHDEIIKAYLAIPLSSSTVPLISSCFSVISLLCFCFTYCTFSAVRMAAWGYLDIVNEKGGLVSKVTDDAPIYN